MGRPIGLLVPPNRRGEEMALLDRIGTGESVRHFELEHVRKDGRIVEVSVSVSAVRNADGQVTGAAVVARDISARRELERLKDEMIATVSHEIRTPLASLVGFSELLLTREWPKVQRREFLETMIREGRRISTLMNDFLDMQRLESGGRLVVPRTTAVRPLLEQAIAATGVDLARPIQLDMPAEVPPVFVDAARIHQVLLNLFSNARKYSPDGGAIAVQARSAGPVVEIAVTDQGLGIPADALPHVFERFYRVEAHDPLRIGGTGLGLAITQQIVKARTAATRGLRAQGRGRAAPSAVRSQPRPRD